MALNIVPFPRYGDILVEKRYIFTYRLHSRLLGAHKNVAMISTTHKTRMAVLSDG